MAAAQSYAEGAALAHQDSSLGRALRDIFDSAYYVRHNPDVASVRRDLLAHYLEIGWAEGRNPCALFENDLYLDLYGDVATAGLNPLVHFVRFGAREGRKCSELFDAVGYLQRNVDVAEARHNPLAHYLTNGASERRSASPLIDDAWYRAQLCGADAPNAAAHYAEHGAENRLSPHPMFDADWYLRQNPDVAAAAKNPLTHYLRNGWLEGRQPNSFFDGDWYLKQNPDVAAAGINPLLHYVTSGAAEGRDPTAALKSRKYIARDTAVSGADTPFTHWLQQQADVTLAAETVAQDHAPPATGMNENVEPIPVSQTTQAPARRRPSKRTYTPDTARYANRPSRSNPKIAGTAISCDVMRANLFPRERALALVLNEQFPLWRTLEVHESSPEPRGISKKLAQQCRGYVASQYFTDLPLGVMHRSFRNENLERQTFGDQTFDLVITLDVMEHVNEPSDCFKEIWRTLRPGGAYLFAVPTYKQNIKTERAARFMADGSIEHYREPEYHGNPVNPQGALVTFRYGYDFPELIRSWAPFDTRVYRFHDHQHGVIGEHTEIYLCSRSEAGG